MGVLSNLKNKISNPKSPGEDINKTWTHRVVEAGLTNGIKATGSLIKGAGSNMLAGHWNESGLANIFGAMPGWEKTKSGKIVRAPKKDKGSGLDAKSAANIETLAANSTKANEHLEGIHSSIVKMDDNMKKGFVGLYQLISGMSRKAKDPFDAVTKRRALLPQNKPALLAGPNAQKSGLGGLFGTLGSLFSKNGLIGAGLSGIMKLARSLMGVVGLLNRGVGKLATAALALVAPMMKGIVKLAGAALLGLGAAAKGIFNRFKGKPRVIAPKPPQLLLEPPRPALEPPKPVVEPEGTRPRPTPTEEAHGRPTPAEPEANRPRPTTEPEANRPAPTEEPHGRPRASTGHPHATEADLLPREPVEGAKPTEPAKPTPKPTETPKPVEAPKPPVEAPKPATTPSGANAAEGATEAVVKEATKDAGKVAAKSSLKGLLGKMFAKVGGRFAGPAGVAVIEGMQGFSEWSEAYDKLQKNEITPTEYKNIQRKVISKAVAGTGGALIGTAIGALGGSLVAGPIGGFIGGLGGGALGAWQGHEMGEQFGDALNKTVFREDGTVAKDEPEAQPQKGPTATPQATPTPAPQGRPAAQLQAQPSRQAPAQNMIQGSQQQARSNNGTTIIAPTTNNTTNNNNSGGRSGSGGSAPQSPGNSRPGYDGLDQNNLGFDIPLMP